MITQGVHTYIGGTINEYFGPRVYIGKFTSIAEGVIWCGAMNHVCVKHPEAVSTFNFRERWKLDYFEGGGVSRGVINVGNDVWIGRDVTIMDGVTIGDGAIIGMKAVVAKDVPPYAVFVGNPGVVKRFRFTPEQIFKLLKIKWWELKDDIIKELVPIMRNVDEFIDYYEKNPDKFGSENRG